VKENMRLVASITEGSGPANEDGCGVIRKGSEVTAAWIFDGVTGINGKNYMAAATDAVWIVERANQHLGSMARWNKPLPDILAALVAALEADWAEASKGITLPADYDAPGACLTLVKKYAGGWKALRLGDSMIITGQEEVTVHPVPRTTLNDEEDMLKREARKRRDVGMLDIKQLLKEFHGPILASRRSRNTAVGIGILVAGPETFVKPEYIDLGSPKSILLCTDGFYRAVDYYEMHSDESLLRTCVVKGGAEEVLRGIRDVEAGDPECKKYLRFKPADDATCVMMVG
jgi:serine/threonine protein phosphatase PrpC